MDSWRVDVERGGRECGGADERLCCGAARTGRELHSTKSSPVPRDVAPRAGSFVTRLLNRFRGLPWVALTVVALLVLSAPFALEPIRDAATLKPMVEAS